MNFVFFVFSLFVVVSSIISTEASGILYSSVANNFHYPYALGYSYIQSPHILPYGYGVYLKHHHPDHKGNDNDDNTSTEKDKKNDDTMIQALNEKMKPDMKESDSQKIKLEDKNGNKDSSLKSQYQEAGSFLLNSGVANSVQMPQTTGQLKYYTFSYPITYTIPTPLYLRTSSQFHHQDGYGHYYYGYTNPESSKQEIKGNDGITRGTYSYVDGDGKTQTVYYLSDSDGFRVIGTNLPQAPTPVETSKAQDDTKLIKNKVLFGKDQLLTLV